MPRMIPQDFSTRSHGDAPDSDSEANEIEDQYKRMLDEAAKKKGLRHRGPNSRFKAYSGIGLLLLVVLGLISFCACNAYFSADSANVKLTAADLGQILGRDVDASRLSETHYRDRLEAEKESLRKEHKENMALGAAVLLKCVLPTTLFALLINAPSWIFGKGCCYCGKDCACVCTCFGKPKWLRRRENPHFALPRRNFIPLFYNRLKFLL